MALLLKESNDIITAYHFHRYQSVSLHQQSIPKVNLIYTLILKRKIPFFFSSVQLLIIMNQQLRFYLMLLIGLKQYQHLHLYPIVIKYVQFLILISRKQ
jgi:hypothetical protein